MNKDLLHHLYIASNISIEKCLFGDLKCENKAINAHSLQNAKEFELISVNGHVATIKQYKTQNHGIDYKWELIGRNKASTFTGLCLLHDSELFKPIDLQNLDMSNKEQLFLLAYRSIHKELHANINAALRLQSVYQKKIDSGLLSGEILTKEGMAATPYLANYLDTILYKEKFDQAYSSSNFTFLEHQSILLKNQNPVLACSQLFSVDSIQGTEDVLRIVLNVIPINNNETFVLFSYLSCDKYLAENYIYKILRGRENIDLFKYNLSKTIIENCSNFYINPDHINSWSDHKKNKILHYFSQTIFGPLELESEYFFLF